MNANDPILTFTLFTGLMLAAIVVVVLNDFLIRRSVRRAERRKSAHPLKHRGNQTQWGLVLLMVILTPAFAYAMLDANRFDRVMRGMKTAFLILVGGSVSILIAYLAVKFVTVNWRNRHFHRALRLVREGHPDAAVALLRDQLRFDRPSVDILNAIAVIYCETQDWESAFHTICEAEAYGIENATVEANKGLILWKLGRLEEAVAILRHAHTTNPRELAVASNYGLLLLEIGEIEEAKEVLAGAEGAIRDMLFFSRGSRLALEHPLNQLREKVASVRQKTGESGP